ncbi:MAG: ComEC/Rec2 family competence protein [Bacteroidaceae bacterium]|nr:ComEC/Rec2 family competence protein [Bacteroidaceae bacterium]
MNPTMRRPIIRIAVLVGAWCCGFLFYLFLGNSMGQTWVECSLGESLFSFWEKVSDALQVRLSGIGLDENTFGQIVALTLGDRQILSTEIKQLYREAGASHLLALSGMHLGILYGAFRLIMRNLAYTRWRWCAFAAIMFVLWSYALMTGCPKSLIRAALMTSLALLLQICGERRDGIDILNVSAAMVLLVDPASLWDIGFQLSCAAMLGIIILGIPATENWRHLPLLPRLVLSSLAISISAQLATLPLTLLYFQSIATYSALTSLVAIPLTTLIIYFSIGIYAGMPWCIPVVKWLIWCQNEVMKLVSSMPGAYIEF